MPKQKNEQPTGEEPQAAPTRYDSLWKALPMEVLLALVRTVVPGIGATLEPWQTEIKFVIERAMDGVFLATVKGIKTLILVEYQNYLDETMPWRIVQYLALLREQYRRLHHVAIEIIPIVIWAIDAPPPVPQYEVWGGGKRYLVCEYEEIRLKSLDWRGVEPLILALAPYLQGVQPTDLPEIAQKLYTEAPAHLKLPVLGALLALGERVYGDITAIKAQILATLEVHMNFIYEAIKESEIGSALVKEGEAKGRQEGEVKGRQEGIKEGEVKGRQEGIKEGELAAFTVLWRTRFGREPTAAELKRVARLSPPRYAALLTALLDATVTADEVFARARRA